MSVDKLGNERHTESLHPYLSVTRRHAKIESTNLSKWCSGLSMVYIVLVESALRMVQNDSISSPLEELINCNSKHDLSTLSILKLTVGS